MGLKDHARAKNVYIQGIEGIAFKIAPFIPFTKPYYIRKAIFKSGTTYRKVLEAGCGTAQQQDREKKTHDQFIQADACALPFKEKSFDLVLALDLLEHVPKWKGEKLLLELERVSQREIVLSLPIGWHPSRHQENPYDEHVSMWSVDEI